MGQIIGGQALRVIGELRTLGPGQRAHNIRWDEFPEKAVPGRMVEPGLKATRPRDRAAAAGVRGGRGVRRADRTSCGRRLERARGGLGRTARSDGAGDAHGERALGGGVGAAAAGEDRSQRTEMQALRLGDGLAVLALPGEFFVETAAAIRAKGGRE